MDYININCNISLSKKLRALIGDNETTLTLITGKLVDGKGNANIVLTLDNFNRAELEELMDKETSIQITPVEMTENIPQNQTITNLFSSTVNPEKASVVSKKIGVVSAPSTREERKYAIKSKQEIEDDMPEDFADTKKTEFKRYISDLNSLMNAVKVAQNKDYGIDLNGISDPRKRALAMEEKEKAESINEPAYIVNDKYASLTLNDLGIQLILNSPFNLANISAKRIAASTELKSMINSGAIKFINPDEVGEYMKKSEAETDMGLEVFGGERGSAKRAARETNREQDDEIDLEIDEESNEQEKLIKATKIGETRSIPMETREGGVRVSRHGNGIPESNRPQREPAKEGKTPAIKTIRRSGIEID